MTKRTTVLQMSLSDIGVCLCELKPSLLMASLYSQLGIADYDGAGTSQKRGPGRPTGGSLGSPVSPKRARLAEERPRGLNFQTMEPANGVSLWRR